MHCTEGSSTEFEATGPCGNTMSYLLQCIMAREPDSLARVCVLHVALQVRTEVFALYDRYTTYFRVRFCWTWKVPRTDNEQRFWKKHNCALVFLRIMNDINNLS